MLCALKWVIHFFTIFFDFFWCNFSDMRNKKSNVPTLAGKYRIYARRTVLQSL